MLIFILNYTHTSSSTKHVDGFFKAPDNEWIYVYSQKYEIMSKVP